MLALLALACGAPGARPGAVPTPTGMNLPPPTRGIQLRVSFDKDPSVYVGRFIPDTIAPGDIDENVATTTRCSKFVKPKTVDTDQKMEETMFVSRNASAALGIPVVGKLEGSMVSHNRVRVRYSITRKIQSDVDADGLAQCCKADPSQCSGKMIGEFLMGTGDVLQSTSDTEQVGAAVTTPHQIQASASAGSDDGWKKTTSFKDVYFAFLTQATPIGLAGGSAAANDCSWCDTLPGSLDGRYFCGVSGDAVDESSARTLAMRAAREQVVQYLGQAITVKSATISSTLTGALQNHDVVATAAEGIAAQVKDEKWCKERVPTPDGEKVRARVLAFYPRTAEDAGRGAVAEAAIAATQKSGKLTKQDEATLRAAAHAK